jgi:hypothetical protein
LNEKETRAFTVGDLASSRVYYKPSKDWTQSDYDYVVLSFVSASTSQVHNILIVFERVEASNNLLSVYKSDNERNTRGFDNQEKRRENGLVKEADNYMYVSG